VPERLLEWVLLLIPPSLFEASLQRFGFDAKRYALYIAIFATLAVLAAVVSMAKVNAPLVAVLVSTGGQ
jgi:hypothetical protein